MQERLALLERVGAEEYNRQIRRHLEESVVERVNGRAIRRVPSRFGVLYSIDNKTAFTTIEEARGQALALK